MRAYIQCLIILVLLPLCVRAGTTGKIAGTVIEAETGEPLPGVNVIVSGTNLGAATDLQGTFHILRVPPGQYSVRATMIGYRPFQYNQVRVSIDKTTNLTFELEPEVLDLGESVIVVASKPLVERDLTSTSASVSSDLIERLPVETVQDVVNLQAGVVEGHFRGGRTGEVAYLIDGMAINDVYSGDYSVQVENTAVQELQVISGTFNAEYGQAMSGVVNIVTKEGGTRTHGHISGYVGDIVSPHTETFWNVDAFNPTYNADFSLSGPVPGTGEHLTYFTSGRFYDTEGHIYGKQVFLPSDSSNFPSNDVRDWMIESRGRTFRFDSREDFDRIQDSIRTAAPYKAMNPSRRLSGQLKLTYRLSGSHKLDYEGLIQHRKYRDYDHRFRYNPDGDFWRIQLGWNNSLSWTHVLSNSTFWTLKLARFYSDYKQYVYSDPDDSRYENPDLLRAASGNAFLTGGQQMWHFKRNTTTSVVKLDFTSQVHRAHQIKMGAEGRLHRLWLRSFEIRLNRDTNWAPSVPTQTQGIQNNDDYLYHPVEWAAYIQDKIELTYMVVNAGVRFDLFASDGYLPTDFQNPTPESVREASYTSQISPRFGLSYPITDRGAIHVSYGHFFQIPNFEHLYTNPEYELYATSNYGSTPPPERVPNTIGNAALKPQKTTIYEMGLQQQLATDIALDVTAYFKDIRNLLGTEILHTTTGIRYARYINRDYGNVKGVTVSLEKRVGGGFGATLDYTYQIARGNASDPSSAFLDVQAGREPQKQLVPLSWDRTHSLNLTVTAGNPDDISASLIGRLGSGLPYTPTQQNVRTAVENSERRPAVYTFDLYASKNMSISGNQASVFVRIFNLFDRKNEREVYTDTGSADYTLSALTGGTVFGLNTLDEYITRPDFYSGPRQILMGISLDF